MLTKFSGLNPNGPYLSLEKRKRHECGKFHFALVQLWLRKCTKMRDARAK